MTRVTGCNDPPLLKNVLRASLSKLAARCVIKRQPAGLLCVPHDANARCLHPSTSSSRGPGRLSSFLFHHEPQSSDGFL
ncbi:hypothetical protein VZT92_002124 [Zoarces viviparus]|uniref:Uncharacterized protein n=1 Tax=Zoarces viviparus TaxID=48416 RepID=A0AAW1G1E8_ZOAVI